MAEYVYTIPGNPLPKARPRLSRFRTYDPQYRLKSAIALTMFQQRRHYLLTGTLEVHFEFHMPIPASYSKRKQLAATHKPHTKKPDMSNLIKMYEDCANGVIYHDDSQIAILRATKLYSDNPRTIITIIEVE